MDLSDQIEGSSAACAQQAEAPEDPSLTQEVASPKCAGPVLTGSAEACAGAWSDAATVP